MSARLSLAMIVKNEEASLEGILTDAAGFCDELVVVDTGSTDRTAEVAERMGARVEHFEWIDDFGAARNYAFEKCTGEWIIWLDADDRVPPESQQGFVALLDELEGRTDIDGVMLPYRSSWREDDPSICFYSYHRERVMRREAGLRWEGAVHECIALGYGRLWTRQTPWVEHRPSGDEDEVSDRNLRILERVIGEGDRSPRTLYYYANELRDHGRFEEANVTYREYLEVSTLDWEKYSAYLHVASCEEALERPDEKVAALLEAIRFDSTRAEAFTILGIHYYSLREWRRAIPLFQAATAAQRPEHGFVSDEHYTWMPWDYLSVCLANAGDHEAAVLATLKALPNNPDKPRLIKNLHWTVDQL